MGKHKGSRIDREKRKPVMEEVVIVGAGRSTLGTFNGSIPSLSHVQVFEMIKRDMNRGLAALCIDGGQSIPLTIER